MCGRAFFIAKIRFPDLPLENGGFIYVVSISRTGQGAFEGVQDRTDLLRASD
jgi:hypothetical protein